jgi:hypothetical protein
MGLARCYRGRVNARRREDSSRANELAGLFRPLISPPGSGEEIGDLSVTLSHRYLAHLAAPTSPQARDLAILMFTAQRGRIKHI